MSKIENVDQFIKRLESKKDHKLDLSSDEDLSLAIMNLISIEEHFFFTAEKTTNDKYFDLLKEAREMRKDLLKMIIKEYDGEVWCISKHLLAASMRLMEVGTKYLGKGQKKEAKEMFDKSYNLYSLFWGINLKAVDIDKVRKIGQNQLDKEDKKESGVFDKMKALVKKAIDCCIE